MSTKDLNIKVRKKIQNMRNVFTWRRMGWLEGGGMVGNVEASKTSSVGLNLRKERAESQSLR